MFHKAEPSSAVPDGRLAGAALVACGVCAIVVVAHHPVVHVHAAAQAVGDIARASAVDRVVHGALIAIAFAQSFALTIFAVRRGFGRPATIAALLAYLAGAAALCGAALIDGFVIPALAARYAGAPDAALAAAAAVMAAAAVTIQVATTFGFLALSAGILLWSLGLFARAGDTRVAGGLGIVAAVVPALIVTAAQPRIVPATLVTALLPQALWYAAVGILMLRRTL